jgi:hypothetical protein
MSVQIRGSGGSLAEVQSGALAVRATAVPNDVGALGAYGVSLGSGVMAAGLAAGAEVFQFRWAHASQLACITRVTMWAGGIGGFTAGVCRFDLAIARGWTADGSGGTPATMTGNNGKKRSSYATSAVGAIRVASTAALGSGTKALDAQALASVGASTLGSASAGDKLVGPVAELFRYEGTNHPILLAANEGLVIRATVPAAGTWSFGVTVEWSELTAF